MAVDPVDIDQLFEAFVALSKQQNFRLLVIPVPQKDKPTGSLDKLQSNVSGSVLAKLEVVDITPIVQNMVGRENKAYKQPDKYWLDQVS